MEDLTSAIFVEIDPRMLPAPANVDAVSSDALVYGYADGHAEFNLTEDGVFWRDLKRKSRSVSKKGSKSELATESKLEPENEPETDNEIKVCGPIVAFAKTNDINHRSAGYLLKFMNQDREQVILHMLRRDIKNPGALIGSLLDHDFYLNPEYEKKLILYLSKANPSLSLNYVTKTGWILEQNAFVIPSVKTICRPSDKPETQLFFKPNESASFLAAFKAHGHLQDWKDHVAKPCRGNPIPIFAIATALAGPLLLPIEMDSFCIHICGASSGGKTTTLQIAASVWGCGADPTSNPSKSFINRWDSTKSALGGLASLVNDTLLVLDEVGTYDGDDFGTTSYSFLGGSSKQASKSNLNLRDQRHWRIITLSSGEDSGKNKIERNRRAFAGQLARFIDIPVPNNIFQETGTRTPQVFADYLKQVCGQYYGTAGPAFVESLFQHTENTYELSQKLKDWFEKNVKELNEFASSFIEISQEKGRVLKRFALIQTAGELASNAQIVPFTIDDIKSAVQDVVKAWVKVAETISDGDRMVQAIKSYLIKNQAGFIDLDAKTPKITGKVIGYSSGEKKHFLLTDESFKAACGDFDEKAVAEELSRRELIIQNREIVNGIEKKRYKIRRKVPTVMGKAYDRFYAVRFDIIKDLA